MPRLPHERPDFKRPPEGGNYVICVTGRGASVPFSCIMTDAIPDLHVVAHSQCFPLYLYEGGRLFPPIEQGTGPVQLSLF